MRLRSLLLVLASLFAPPAHAQVLLLDHLEAYVDGAAQGPATIDGLNFAWAVATSPDGAHVYVCSGVNNIAAGDEDDNALAVFARDLDTGLLTFVESHFDDDDTNDAGTADGLLSCRDVDVSPDGKHVYTAGSSDHAIGIFSRNAATGALTFLSTVQDGAGGVDGLAGVEALALTSDGSALFAVGRADDALVAFSRNATTGALVFEDVKRNGLGGVTGLDRPLGVAPSHDGAHVYVAAGSNANFSGSDALTAFAWDPGMGPGDGALTFLAAYAEGAAQGGRTIDGLDQLSDVVVSHDGRHVYAASEVDTIGGPSGNGNDWIAIFARDPATGALTWLDAISGFKICPTSPFGADAESFIVASADDSRIYVTKNWADNGVAVFARDPATGGLTFMDGLCDFDPDAIGLNLPRRMCLDPSGRNLYVAGNASDAVSVAETRVLGLADVAAAKAALKCQTAIEKGGVKLVDKELKALAKCLDGLQKCVQTQGADKVDACVAKAAGKCDAGLAKILGKERDAFAAAIRKKCDVSALTLPDDLLADQGLGFAHAESACESALTSLDDVVECVVDHAACRAERLALVEIPRGLDLMTAAGVDGTILAELGCLESFGGGAAGFGAIDPKGTGKAVVRCGKEIEKAGKKFATAKLKGLGKCLDAVLKCVMTKPGVAKCLDGAAKKCAKELDPGGKIDKAATKLRDAIAKKCGSADFSTVLAVPAGLGLAAAADACAAVGVTPLDDVADHAECAFRHHECMVDELIRLQVPLADDLLALVGTILPDDFCPAP